MAETAREAIDRAARTVIDRVAVDANLRTAGELEPGNWCKAGGEWFTVEKRTDAGDLMLLHGGQRMFYKVTVGELFVWHEGAF